MFGDCLLPDLTKDVAKGRLQGDEKAKLVRERIPKYSLGL